MENLLQKTVLKEKTSCFTFIKLHLWSFAESQRLAPQTSNGGQKSFLLTGRNLGAGLGLYGSDGKRGGGEGESRQGDG